MSRIAALAIRAGSAFDHRDPATIGDCQVAAIGAHRDATRDANYWKLQLIQAGGA